MTAWQDRWAAVNGIRLHYVEAGAGPAVLLLHGFPEFWYSWRHQIPALAAAGFRVLAPDLRGYNLSDKPRGVANYGLQHLVGDVEGLVRDTGRPRAAVVGHDWGGAIAWAFAMRRPELVDRLIIINAPHPAAYLRELRTLDQLLRSWYVFFFQMPSVPEWRFRRRHFALLQEALRRPPTRPGAFTDDDIRLYKEAFARPGALTAAINYYRAVFRSRFRRARDEARLVTVPTLLLWGERDPYLSPRLTEGLSQWVPHLRVERFADAAHWPHVEWPDRVNSYMIEFLRRSPV